MVASGTQLARGDVSNERSMLGGSWLVSGVTSRVPRVITHIKGLKTPLITTHEPPSGCRGQTKCWDSRKDGVDEALRSVDQYDELRHGAGSGVEAPLPVASMTVDHEVLPAQNNLTAVDSRL